MVARLSSQQQRVLPCTGRSASYNKKKREREKERAVLLALRSSASHPCPTTLSVPLQTSLQVTNLGGLLDFKFHGGSSLRYATSSPYAVMPFALGSVSSSLLAPTYTHSDLRLVRGQCPAATTTTAELSGTEDTNAEPRRGIVELKELIQVGERASE